MGRVTPELPWARRRELEPWDMWARMRAHLALLLDLELVCGVPGLQGIDSGSRAHPGRGSEPAGGASIFSHATFLNLVPCYLTVISPGP
jgi:hypothetical protein